MVSCPKANEIVNKEIQVTRKFFLIIIKSKKEMITRATDNCYVIDAVKKLN